MDAIHLVTCEAAAGAVRGAAAEGEVRHIGVEGLAALMAVGRGRDEWERERWERGADGEGSGEERTTS